MIIESRAVLALLAAAVVLAAPRAFAQDHIPVLGQFEFTGDSLVLALTEQGGHPKVIVDIGDGKQHEFIVDTGASVNVIDSALAKVMGYEVVGEIEIGAPGGPQVPGNIVKVPLAHVSDATITDAEFVTMDLVKFSGGTMQGVLGMGLFRDYLLTYDLGGGEIRVSREALEDGGPGVIHYNDIGGHMQIDMDVAGTTLATHIDTGSMGAFTLPAELKESLPLRESGQSSRKARVVGGDRDIQLAQLDGDILFAGSTYEEPTVAFMDPSPGYGNVGGQILGEFVMSIDQKNHLVGFQKSKKKPVAAASNGPRRLGVQFRGMPGGSVLTIGVVDPGSLGEKSGLMPGDVLLTLNDKPTEEYDMKSLGTLFRSSEPLSFEVERDGEVQTINIPKFCKQ